ncbi:hypothetical protein BJ138DRAFT_889319 [Hygrophoropsis aurantiaca]|uniref:Uncharacterized protein n=1 Tax=Hygrophoropsis aurantiaca TaxID=72124 RepID=A0ACB8AEY1_9AGAM|nr:hypothetical protein BJ138DRAFT_889319 [Hygrophoropsis aurantiaca]
MSRPDGDLSLVEHPASAKESGSHLNEPHAMDQSQPPDDIMAQTVDVLSKSQSISSGFFSEAGLSYSSSSSGEIVGTPFDTGSRRFEYPFPDGQTPSSEAFSPLSSSITSAASSLPSSPPWPYHVSKSFPLSAPPASKIKAHPKLRTPSAREPPVPPGLVKKRNRMSAELQRHSSDEGQQSDASEVVERGRKSSRLSARIQGMTAYKDTDAQQNLPVATELGDSPQDNSVELSVTQGDSGGDHRPLRREKDHPPQKSSVRVMIRILASRSKCPPLNFHYKLFTLASFQLVFEVLFWVLRFLGVRKAGREPLLCVMIFFFFFIGFYGATHGHRHVKPPHIPYDTFPLLPLHDRRHSYASHSTCFRFHKYADL